MTRSEPGFRGEELSNTHRRTITEFEPRGLRTYTPTMAVLERSAGIYHWTPEGRRLYDYTSGVLVANLGHNPQAWLQRFWHYLGWDRGSGIGDRGSETIAQAQSRQGSQVGQPSHDPRDGMIGPYLSAAPLTAYNATTPLEAQACRRLLANLQSRPGGRSMEQIFWAASGSEAIQKALWCALHRDPSRNMILATRRGFHGKKGLAGACTGDENSPERDPRVRFISFPLEECKDVARNNRPFDLTPYQEELRRLKAELGDRLCCLITEPYLGGAGSYHPPAAYLQGLQQFCRENDLIFILDEVQSNFGRTGRMYAFETYGLQPDVVVLGKGMGNGVPVAAAVGRADVLGSLDYGEGSDTYSANPLCCAAVLATLDLYENADLLGHAQCIAEILEAGLLRLKAINFVTHVRGEGVVWGVEVGPFAGQSDSEIANACVRACYLGDAEGNAIHLLGPLAGNVLRISPPLVISEEEAKRSLDVLFNLLQTLAIQLATTPVVARSLHG